MEPPKHFQVETESKSSSNGHLRCKLCKTTKKHFCCKNCVSTGVFISKNSMKGEERFVDKQQKLKNLLNAQEKLEEKFNVKFENLLRIENLRAKILKSRSRNAILERLIEEKRNNIQKFSEAKKENHDKNRAQSRILPKYEDKVNKLGDYVLEAVEKNDNLRKKSLEQMEQLKLLRREYIDKLVKFIFPMSPQISRNSGHRASNESLKTETMSEIAEAMLMTTPVTNEWTANSVDQYVIVAPSLNSNGNYQEYCDWIHSNKDGTANSGMNATPGSSEPGQVANNHAYRIAAALTYITQLVQVLSYFLDVRLPHKVLCNDFCTMGLNEQQFRKKVARLNLNIVYLCYTQNLSMKTVQPAHTMENIFQLLDIRNASNLGRTGPVLDSSQRSVDSIMQSFTEIFDDDHSDTDDDDSDDTTLQKDWENVGNLPLVEMQSVMVPQQTVSMAGTLMNVAQSLWKWK